MSDNKLVAIIVLAVLSGCTVQEMARSNWSPCFAFCTVTTPDPTVKTIPQQADNIQ